MSAASHRPFGFAIVALICILLSGAVTVSAQATPTPITIGQNQTGNLTDASGSIAYTLALDTPQSINIQLVAITAGFAPTFRVLDPGGLVVFDSPNDGTQAITQGAPNLSSAGTYRIEIRSASASTGQFLLSLQAGTPLAPPTPLTPGTPVNSSVDGQTTRRAYSFSGSTSDKLLLTVSSTGDEAAIVIALRDASTHELISLNSAGLLGLSYRLPAQARDYLLEITSGSPGTSQAFSVCLAAESGAAPCPGGTTSATVVEATTQPTLIAAVPSLTPTFAPASINPGGACEVTPSRNNSVNVRSGAGTGYPIVATLPASATALVVGRLPDNSWYQVNVNGVLGWVSSTVVIPGGNCASVAVVILPTAVPPVVPPPVVPPTAVMPPFGSVFTDTPAPTTLNANAYSTNNGEEDTIGDTFYPPPLSWNIGAGGDVDVSYLGNGCSGYASSAPNMIITYNGSVDVDELGFYFLANGGDALMIVRNPAGRITCNDNSPNSINPEVAYVNTGLGHAVRDGRYEIWIAYPFPADFGTRQGTLYVTLGAADHP